MAGRAVRRHAAVGDPRTRPPPGGERTRAPPTAWRPTSDGRTRAHCAAVVLDAAARQDGGASGRTPGEDPWRIDRMVWPLLAVFDDLARRGHPADVHRACRPGRPGSPACVPSPTCSTATTSTDRTWSARGQTPGADTAGWSTARATHWPPTPRGSRSSGASCGTRSAPRARRSAWPTVVDRVAEGALDLDDELPPRLLLFGFTALPGQDFLPLVEAVARRRAVHLFLLVPHQFDPAALLAAWPAPTDGRPRLRSEDLTAAAVRHPLLRSWGRLSREAALLIADRAGPGIDVVTGSEGRADRAPRAPPGGDPGRRTGCAVTPRPERPVGAVPRLLRCEAPGPGGP